VEHVCALGSAWPTGHPLPPEDPDKLQGPEVGEFVIYRDSYVVRVLHRSYVWSPGECRSNGGYRHYDWSVIERGPGEYRAVVVNDTDLTPIPPDMRVVYATHQKGT
jgi:hypothetical protein